MANIFHKVGDYIEKKFANEKTTPQTQASVSGSTWKKRIEASNENFAKWERKFKCKKLVEYYEGHQWEENDRYEPYVINLVFSTIEVKKPNLLFTEPIFHLKPRPNTADFDFETAQAKAQLNEDTLNYFVTSDLVGLAEEAELAILDNFFYFGIIEIGYGADWIDNPNAGKPILKADYDIDADPDKVEEIFEPEKLPEKEYIYTKRIPAMRFRVGGNDHNRLERNNWVGYYEYIRVEDLIAAGADKDIVGNPIGLHKSADFSADNENGITRNGDLVKVWKIWDLRAKEKLVILDGTGDIIFEPVKFKRLPLKALKFHPRTKGFLPVPPVFNWKAPQDEINEAHEMNRAHRRKARSLYQCVDQQCDPDEKDKMLTAPDMTIINVKQPNAITPIMNPSVDASMGVALNITKDDFLIVSGTSSEDTGVSDRQTATDAQLKHQKSQIRENFTQKIVAKWLCEIGEEILLQIREKFTLPFWIEVNADKPENPDEVAEIKRVYKLIEADDLDGIDCVVDVSVESLSPVANNDEKQKFLEFLTLLQQFPVLATNPDLIFELAARCGYRNTKVIRQIVKVAQLQLMIQMSQLQGTASAAAGGGGNAMPPNGGPQAQAQNNMVQNRKSPQLEQIRQQLLAQNAG